MTTTIQISDSTKQMLNWLKNREKAETYDKLIQHLVKMHAHVPKTMFGSCKNLEWKNKDRMILHEL